MLVVDPTKRASLHEVIQHPWMSKGYEYPVPSYINKRVPLTLPLDPEIIKSIATLDLGSSQAIVEELTNVVSSPEYQMSSEIWYKQAKQGRPYIPGPSTHNLPDPTGGFNPLVSIYYLVDEMRKRKKAKEEALKINYRASFRKATPVHTIRYTNRSICRDSSTTHQSLHRLQVVHQTHLRHKLASRHAGRPPSITAHLNHHQNQPSQFPRYNSQSKLIRPWFQALLTESLCHQVQTRARFNSRCCCSIALASQ